MPTYLEIAVNIPQVTEVFHYHLPPELEGRVLVGQLVEVPFGAQQVQGVVLRLIQEPAVKDTRPVSRLVDPDVVLTPAQIELAKEISRSSLAPLATCISLMLPAGLNQMVDTYFTLNLQAIKEISGSGLPQEPLEQSLSETQLRLVTLLKRRGGLRGRQIDQALPHLNWRPSSRALIRRGLLSAQSVLPPPSVHPKIVRTVQLAVSPMEADAQLPGLGRSNSQALSRRQAILRFLMREPGPVDVAWVYAESGGRLADLHFLAERQLVVLGESEVWRDPLNKHQFVATEPPPLIHDQEVAWREIKGALRFAAAGRGAPPVLLHGVTGSGKTEIYLRAVAETIDLGRQAIVLVPEIALTPQTVRRFVSRFPGQVGLVHSRLTAGERYDTWRRARAGLLTVIIGPRSALFTPFAKLGLIVVDECHDDSYYQGEIPPFYHAQDVALKYARLAGAVCLWGSATPDVSHRYRADRERWHCLSLPARVLAHRQAVREQVTQSGLKSRFQPLGEMVETMPLPQVQVVDMRQELKAGNTSMFSRSLVTTLQTVLAQKEQAILFLNRRGTSTYVFCRDCGFVLKCPRCDLPLIYHALSGAEPTQDGKPASYLLCHHCGYERSLPGSCPQCRSPRIRHYGSGTERVEVEVQKLLPEARTLRWDYDTTRQRGAHEIILSHFAAHRADILIGTQMVAKGLDLPLVTLVGVILADVGINLPDFRAGERTFQLLTQVAGRAGRSALGGQVILQTFQPDHYVIQAASRHDYQSFYQRELEYRRRLAYPPFVRLVRFEFRDRDPSQVKQVALEWAKKIRARLETEDRRATQMIGPVPCFYARLGGHYRWQIVLHGPNPASLLKGHYFPDCRVEVDPPSLL